MLDWIFEGIANWVASIMTQLMDAVSGLFLDALGTDMTAMEEYFAVVKNTSEYVETVCTEYADGTITLHQDGGYVGQFRVTWKKRTYDNEGKERIKDGGWDKNGHDITSPFSEDIRLEGNCFDIHVEAKECTGLAWEWWRKLIDVSDVPLIKHRTFHIGGTTLSPSKSIDPAI